MFPYSSNVLSTDATGNYYEPAVPSAHGQSRLIHSRPFLNDITTNPNCNSALVISNSEKDQAQAQDLQEDPHHHIHTPFSPLSFFCFPSPFEDDDVLLRHRHQHELLSLHENTLLAHHQYQTGTPLTATMAEWDSNKDGQAVINKEGEQLKQQKQIPIMRRPCKKDRHSKIITARGLRDRRMRLSLDVAREFFGLQDMLGFEKGSKTVEWLLNQAGAEIKKLKKVTREMKSQTENQSSSTAIAAEGGAGARTTSSISECEVVSGTDEVATDDIIDKVSLKISSCAKNRIKRMVKQPKKSAVFNPLAKASRERARERARERTREKMGRQSKPCDDVDEAKKMKPDQSRLSSWITFETGEESGGTQSHNNNMNNHSPLEALAEVEEPISSFQAAGTVVHPHIHQDLNGTDAPDAAANLVTMGKWNPSLYFNYLQNTSASISQEQHEFADFQFFGKPWEIYNSNTHNLF